MRTANEIAEWIVRYSADDLGAPVDPMSLQKLAYYVQAFYLALNDQPMFSEEIKAWKWGPVIPAVYHRYSSFGAAPIFSETDKSIVEFGRDHLAGFLSQVVDFFRRYTAPELSRATHLEAPWRDASDVEDNTIPQEIMKVYYRSLISEGELALSRHELLDTIPEPRWSSYYIAGICWRKMADHPFYDAALAKKLAEPTPRRAFLPRSFFAPVKERDFVEFSRDEDPEETIKRVTSGN
ncbi:MAG TPA: type II toxin-antitoxin system antitoxin SocA domain-containing protein [Xanthobacteraceae bacterium]